jgi:hypothetical protein
MGMTHYNTSSHFFIFYLISIPFSPGKGCKNLSIRFLGGCLKSHHPAKREESYNIVYQYFPLLFKGGVSYPKGYDGVENAFETASWGEINIRENGKKGVSSLDINKGHPPNGGQPLLFRFISNYFYFLYPYTAKTPRVSSILRS